jgi:hypothetical protein
MAQYTCPSCGADLPFRSSVSVYAVCASCGSTVVRTDLAVEAIGIMATLPDEITPLQIGARLAWQGRHFTLLGRLRIGWEDGAWTEWFMDDGAASQAWLTEAQGLLAVSVEQDVPPALAAAPSLGEVVMLGSTGFRVADIKRGTCLGSEGELPFAAPKGRIATYIDMVGQTAGFAGLEESEDGRRLYTGTYVPFERLGFTGLRDVEGWPPPLPDPERRHDPRYLTH